jgi:hypothetical protein
MSLRTVTILKFLRPSSINNEYDIKMYIIVKIHYLEKMKLQFHSDKTIEHIM